MATLIISGCDDIMLCTLKWSVDIIFIIKTEVVRKMRRKNRVAKKLITLMLIAGMCLPAQMTFAAEAPVQVTESGAEVYDQDDAAADAADSAEAEQTQEAAEETAAATESESQTENNENQQQEQTEQKTDDIPAQNGEEGQQSESTQPSEEQTDTDTQVQPVTESESAMPAQTETETVAETETETETASETETETEEPALLEASDADKPGEIKNLKATTTDYTITLTWDAADKASAYILYAYDKKTEKRKRILNTVNTTYTFTDLTPGTAYSYVLIPYNKDVTPTAYGPVTEPVTAVPGRPGNIPKISIKSGNKAVTLSWTAAKDAVGYKIFAYNKKTKKLTAVVSTRNRSYTITGLENGTEYSYRVRPYNKPETKAIFGNYSKVVSAVAGQPGAIRNLKIRSGNGSAVLSWNAAVNATGYRIFFYDPKTGGVEGITSVNTRTCRVTGLTNGKSYSFMVRPYNSSGEKLVCGPYSTAVTTIPGKPDPITDLKGVGADGEVILSWSKSEVSQYYQVFQYDFTAKRWRNIMRVTGTTAVISNLTNNTTYRFRVLDYNRINGKLYYAGSNIVNVKPSASYSGWVTVNGKKFYYRNGSRLKKYQQISGKYYYFDEETGEMLTGWHYAYGFKLYFDPKTGARWNDVDSLIGKQSSYVIKVNCQANVVNIYAKDGDNGYVIPVKAFVCTTGASSTPTVKGTFYTPDKWRWQVLMGPSYGQWVTQIYRGYYFPSVFYNRYNDNNSLAIGAYNNLGNSGSHGCVRLTAGDAKWIYDNCKLGTKVITYSDSTPGPLGKPSSYHLPSWHTWDPTDPNMRYKCKQHGCH